MTTQGRDPNALEFKFLSALTAITQPAPSRLLERYPEIARLRDESEPNTRPRTFSSNAEYQRQSGQDDEHEREVSNQAGRHDARLFQSLTGSQISCTSMKGQC
jgi:hypothetical protein